MATAEEIKIGRKSLMPQYHKKILARVRAFSKKPSPFDLLTLYREFYSGKMK